MASPQAQPRSAHLSTLKPAPRLFNCLPEDILYRLTRYLGEHDIISLTQTSRHLYDLTQEESFWYPLSIRKFDKIMRHQGSCRLAFLKSRDLKFSCAQSCDHQAPNGRIIVTPHPEIADLQLLTVLCANNFKIAAMFPSVPAGVYQIVWQVYITDETAGFRDINFRSFVYKRNEMYNRSQHDYRPKENLFTRFPKEKITSIISPQPIVVMPDQEYSTVIAETISIGFNWKSNILMIEPVSNSFVSVALRPISPQADNGIGMLHSQLGFRS
ncbi:hypothetical protein H4R33_004200 [Dimargaris cristalligena]|uniref:F-box domain-containing protein n=1 Tax=Dimargaris cristalligena TaxID=215637 RepID=A0A4P9ZX09_9FUNG|nr:hypothetical protein H4R33_004200 [Dimargaris cristalligena]RKP38204.1 hypothetical protein BJ085DRAFT_31656 [Dimargaris cristalligena]|eukprot:RKP38204.1 hypothetical protein BJ085DRAFT_31656 [Dimargaris cristalligena]